MKKKVNKTNITFIRWEYYQKRPQTCNNVITTDSQVQRMVHRTHQDSSNRQHSIHSVLGQRWEDIYLNCPEIFGVFYQVAVVTLIKLIFITCDLLMKILYLYLWKAEHMLHIVSNKSYELLNIFVCNMGAYILKCFWPGSFYLKGFYPMPLQGRLIREYLRYSIFILLISGFGDWPLDTNAFDIFVG